MSAELDLQDVAATSPPAERERQRLLAVVDAAQAVVDRWDTPRWKDVPATAGYIERLRKAIDKASAGD